jgi:hypothetical protein
MLAVHVSETQASGQQQHQQNISWWNSPVAIQATCGVHEQYSIS